MENNIFKNISNKKEHFKSVLKKAHEFDWITQDELNVILDKLDNDKLTIGVIGQMKCGKSTFLNALVFGDQILPAATTPMTASLSVITYGAEKLIEAEFYTSNEWEELMFQAKRDISQLEGDENLISKIKVAKEIFVKSFNIQSEIPSLLGTKKIEAFNQLIDYVGADGKYISITKSVIIYIPLEYLKGVEIVDTPGFNDPIVSREERTKEFLSKADAVVMLLYAGRAFDSTDKDIIFNKLRSIGIGKIIIGVNKYDLPYANGENPKEIIENVKQQLLKASEEYSSNSISELVIQKEPMLLSASMALMAKMPFNEAKEKVIDFDWYYKKACDTFEISSQHQMLEKSLFQNFENELMDVIFKSKEDILLKKPRNLIKQRGENKKDEISKKIFTTRNKIIILEKPDHELDQLLVNSKKAKGKIEKKIEILILEVIEVLNLRAKSITGEIEDIRDRYYDVINSYLNGELFVYNISKHEEIIKDYLKKLEKEVNKYINKNNKELNNDLKTILKEFIDDIEVIMESFSDDFDKEYQIRKIKSKLNDEVISFEFNNLFIFPEEEMQTSILEDGLVLIGYFIHSATFMSSNLINGKSYLKKSVSDVFSLLHVKNAKDSILNSGKELTDEISSLLIGEFLNPIIINVEKIIQDKSEREFYLLELKEEEIRLINFNSEIEIQILELNNLL